MTRTKTITNSKTSTTSTANDAYTAAGTRTVTWSTGTTTSSTITRSKSIIITNMKRTRDFTNVAGTKVSTSSTVNTDTSNPLVVSVVRDASTGKLQTKTIVSGITNSVDGSSNNTQLTFSNVKYDLTQTSNVCLPVSGTIKGNVYASGSTTASQTFIITFDSTADSPATISFDGGTTTTDYQQTGTGCDLARES